MEVDSLPNGSKQSALGLIKSIEVSAAEQMSLILGAGEILSRIDDNKIKKGLLTRNCRDTVTMFNENILIAKNLIPFSVAVSRCDMDNLKECKPHPKGILTIWYDYIRDWYCIYADLQLRIL